MEEAGNVWLEGARATLVRDPEAGGHMVIR